MRIKKIINNNILCAVDEKGNELIVTGRGIGFQRHRGELLDPSTVERIYRMEEKTVQRRLQELVEKIPVEHLNLTEDLIGHIKTQIPQKLNESLLITLADHISFAILRKTQGVAFSNPLKGAIMCYYPTEYQLGLYCLKMIRQQLGVALQEDEAAFIALHIVNAELLPILLSYEYPANGWAFLLHGYQFCDGNYDRQHAIIHGYCPPFPFYLSIYSVDSVIANQCAHWCGNPPVFPAISRTFHRRKSWLLNSYLSQKI